ncbi:MAG: chemotaxis protein CheC [Peptostreptococcaceae bacterium]
MLDNEKISIFKEISNIGSGNASNSLSKMIDEMVDIGIPKSDMVNFSSITDEYDSPEEVVVGNVLQLSGDIDGFIMIVMKVEAAFNLLTRITQQAVKYDPNDYDDIRQQLSSMGEICNILCGTYLNAMSEMTSMSITQSVPYFSIDMITAIMNLPISLYGPVADSAICIETDFFTMDQEVKGKYYFMPELESCAKVLEKLGMA